MWQAISAVWLTLALGMLVHWIVKRLFRSDGTRDVVESEEISTLDVVPGESKPLHKYDVFINHRGPDVKDTFAAHLSGALRTAGFIPFLDAKCIKQGKGVFTSIDGALSGASVHIAIFSKRYAESKYCLDELLDMLHSGKVILPVFYDVQPQDLRYIEAGPFAAGFRKHAKRKKHHKMRQWKEALHKVSATMGYVKNGDESELVRSIVLAVRNEMPVRVQPQKRRFGLEESMKKLVTRFNMMEDNVNIIGLVGLGGIGKTTLATEFYNSFISHFQHHCFLHDVRSSNQFELRRQLLRALIQEELESNSSEEYLRKVGVLTSRRVLLIVDDIDNESQFANLIPDIQKLGSGSRVLITSRHGDVLNFTMRHASSKDIYEVQVLNPKDSRHLFNWHAFLSETASPGFRDLAEKVAKACGGHPLALEVIGASLFEKNEEAIWMDAIKSLKENEDILGKLRISYDCLPTEGDKAMFRDIACLLIGMPSEVAMLIWKSCHSCGQGYCVTSKTPDLVLRRLLDKSLVKLDSGRLSMHDVLRDMGRDVVKNSSPKPEERTHLWDTSTCAKVLNKNKRSDSVRGMRLSVTDTDGALTSCRASNFAGMEELHLLVLDGYPIDPDDFSSWPQELRWLEWKSLPYSELPLQLNLPKLTVLDLTDNGNLTRLWPLGAFVEFPLLQRLILTNCRALEELPENIGQSMPRLNTVEMDRCSLLAVLPDSLGQLRLLEHLILSECENLKALPDTMVTLVRLQKLILDGCMSLRQLPVSMAGLGMLRELHMKRCGVKDLPGDFGRLTSLTSLSMDELHTVSETFGRLESLEILHVEEAPDRGRWFSGSSLGALTALKSLHLCNNPTITALPKSFGSMKALLYLQMVNASALVTIEVLPQSLQHLNLAHCRQLMSIPSLAQMNSLVLLDLCNCESLTHVQGLECLTALENINLSGVTSLSACNSDVQSEHNRALHICCVSGSRVGVAFNTRWMERKPAMQLISYYDDTIGYFPNGMARKVINMEWCFECVMWATILSKADCVALMFCVVAHDQGWSSFPKDHGSYYNGNTGCCIKVQVMRGGKVVAETDLLNLRHADGTNQVYLWTLRREHPVVQSLQFGDKICVYARAWYPGWKITVEEGALCVIHDDDDHLTLGINSELLSRSESEALVTKLSHLVLVDQFHLSLKLEVENTDDSAELRSSAGDEDSLSDATDPAVGIFPQQGWLIAPAYGHYQWTHSWKLPRRGQGCISFEAQGQNNVHVLISQHCYHSSASHMYEVIIGGSGNTTSLINRYEGRGAWPCCSVEAGLLHPKGSNRLWLSIDEQTSVIQVGRGDPGHDVIAVFYDKWYLSTVENITFTSLDTPVTYSNIAIQDLPPVYRLPQKLLQPVVDHSNKWAMAAKYHGHYTWAQHWTLPAAGRGIISFATDGCVEVYVAISSSPKTLDPMYEIVIGGYAVWAGGPVIVLRRKSQGSVVCRVETGDSFAPGINRFWVMLDDRSGTVFVGQGEPCDNTFLVYKDADFLTDALHCTFTTWHLPHTYSSVAINEVLEQ